MNPCATERVLLDSKGVIWVGFWKDLSASLGGQAARWVGAICIPGSAKVRIKGVSGKMEQASESGVD